MSSFIRPVRRNIYVYFAVVYPRRKEILYIGRVPYSIVECRRAVKTSTDPRRRHCRVLFVYEYFERTESLIRARAARIRIRIYIYIFLLNIDLSE